MQNILEKFGSLGAIITAAACPICFPKLAILGGLLGFGALAKFETAFFFGAQILFVLALLGHALSFRKHRNKVILALAGLSTLLLFLSLYAVRSEIVSYLAFIGLGIATIWLMLENRRCAVCESAQ